MSEEKKVAVVGNKLPTALAGLTAQQLAALPQVIGTIVLGEGHETVEGIEEVTLPRASLMQLTSQAVKESSDDTPVKAGTIINSLTKKVLPLKFVPIFKFTNFIQWNPRKTSDPNFNKDYQPGEMIFQTVNVKDARCQQSDDLYPDGYLQFSKNSDAPKVTRYMNFLCYFEGNGLPLILSFAKTSMKGGTNLNSLMKMYGGNVWDYKYQLTIRCKDGQEGSYYIMDVQPGSQVSPEEKIIGKLWFDMFHNKDLNIDVDQESASVTASTDQNWEE